jgi:hypothetical protein
VRARTWMAGPMPPLDLLSCAARCCSPPPAARPTAPAPPPRSAQSSTSLASWAALAVKQAKWHRAARLFGASEALQDAIYTPLLPWDVSQVQRNVAALRQVLPASELNAHWAAGRAMSMEQAIDDALTTYPFEQQ